MNDYLSLIMDIEKSRRYSIEEGTELQKYITYTING